MGISVSGHGGTEPRRDETDRWTAGRQAAELAGLVVDVVALEAVCRAERRRWPKL